ncbi:SRPBCC family protein [Microlunatus speluncae]|uniref:SRPBCC family protein n=1 Tax=Microlunatus speluncae TaxID=2594267 RepID=UPI001C2D2B88|nr:SRPBCC family protein [Microlunatus speluncae]
MASNVHERTINASATEVGALLDRLGGPDDRLWPGPEWAPMILDRPLQVGADGGHGSVRYRVIEHQPGQRVRFEFRPGVGFDGWHEFTVEPLGADRCRIRHVVLAEPRGLMRILFPLCVEALHDAVLEDLLDRAELAATGRVERPARWSAWVRLWRLTEGAERRRGAEYAAALGVSGPVAAR